MTICFLCKPNLYLLIYSHFEFFLSKGPLSLYEWTDDVQLLQSSGRISPCLWGWPSKSLLDLDMIPLDLSSDAFEFLHALDSFSCSKQLGSLPLDWDSTRIASMARDLQRKQVILLSSASSSAT